VKTIDEQFAVYTQEPFDLRPWEIARMTDWQLEKLYRAPAVRAAREAKGLPPEEPVGGDGDSMPRDREAFVAWWREVNGGDRESALKRYAVEFPDAADRE
jgi:hypothetical protein